MSSKYLDYNKFFEDNWEINWQEIEASVNPKVSEENKLLVVMGEVNENLYEEAIFETLNANLKRTGGSSNNTHFETIDWCDASNNAELKSRTYNHNSFKEGQMVGWNKVKVWLDEPDKRSIFFFGCMDGLYMWECNNTNFNLIGGKSCVKTMDKSETKITYSSLNPNKLHLFIPNNSLVKVLSKKENYVGKCWIHPTILERKQIELNNWIKKQPKKETCFWKKKR